MPGPFDIVPDDRRTVRWLEGKVEFITTWRPDLDYQHTLYARFRCNGEWYATILLTCYLDEWSEQIDERVAHAHSEVARIEVESA